LGRFRARVRRIELVASRAPEAYDVAENPETVQPTVDIILRARHRLAELDALLAKSPGRDD